MKLEDIQSVEPLQKLEDTDSKFGPKFKVTMKDGSIIQTHTDPRENVLGGDNECNCCLFHCCQDNSNVSSESPSNNCSIL